uniref:Uncharacterized protein n=1 Tax=Candidatus Kentrum eta TaxID=2126337 RepID=A0A450VMN1_9GAMM|nr:MAG: hypothetical protein BECKH772B_GA0070898_105702 [Candidatus Kentron sp. H]VFK05960.1 MAG: hypothetical protein BECKH772A_GA0070896_106032 [Candidatus Kentron sp. H]VFK09035.1 MAG: hypothetical protein BECKH772C_GA0070978_105722 [Candidatus Kentron sp. H]
MQSHQKAGYMDAIPSFMLRSISSLHSGGGPYMEEMREFMNSKGFADVVRDLTCEKCTNFTTTEQQEV